MQTSMTLTGTLISGLVQLSKHLLAFLSSSALEVGLSVIPSWITLRTAHRQKIVFCFLVDENGTKSKMNGIKICFK